MAFGKLFGLNGDGTLSLLERIVDRSFLRLTAKEIFNSNDNLAYRQALRHYEIMQDSLELIATTTNPDTLFHRYSLALKEAQTVIELRGDRHLQKGAQYALAFLRAGKRDILDAFFFRCNAKGNLPFIRNEIMAHQREIPSKSLALLQELLEETETDIQTEFIYCGVVFPPATKLYYYIADAYYDVRCGDIVTVPIGPDNDPAEAKIVKIQRFKGASAPYPVSKTKRILFVHR